jgi:hypothetical protein
VTHFQIICLHQLKAIITLHEAQNKVIHSSPNAISYMYKKLVHDLKWTYDYYFNFIISFFINYYYYLFYFLFSYSFSVMGLQLWLSQKLSLENTGICTPILNILLFNTVKPVTKGMIELML